MANHFSLSNIFQAIKPILPQPVQALGQIVEGVSSVIPQVLPTLKKQYQELKRPEQGGIYDTQGALDAGWSSAEIRAHIQKHGFRSSIPLPDEPQPEPLYDPSGRPLLPQMTGELKTHADPTQEKSPYDFRNPPLTPSGHESWLEDFVKEFPRRAANVGIQGSASFIEGLTGLPDLLLPGTPITDVTKKYFTQPARDIALREFGETPESYSTKIGDISGTLGAMLPSIGAASKIAAPVVGALGKIPYAGGPLGFLTKSAATTTGALAPLTGELPSKEELGVGLLVDIVFAGLGRAFGPQKMQHKAMGLSGEIDKKLSKIVRSVKDPVGKPIYENIDDFALKNNISGSRAEMVEKAKELFQEAKSSKAALFENIKTMTKVDDLFKDFGNTYDDFITELAKKYDNFGTQNELAEIIKLGKRKILSGTELEKLRYLADSDLPPSAYRAALSLGAERGKLKGMERAINLFRNRLADIDPTGTIRKLNLHKKILTSATEQASKSLTSAIEATKGRDIFIKGGIRSLIGGAGGYSLSTLFPSLFGAGTAATAIPAVYEALTSIPQISSELARIGAKLGKTGLPQVIPPLTKGALRALVPQTESEEEKKARIQQEDRLQRIQEQQERMLR